MATRELTLVKTTLILLISTICIVFVPTVHISTFVSTSIELVCIVVQWHFNVLWQRYIHSLLRSVWQKVQAAILLLCSGTASGVLISLSKATEPKGGYITKFLMHLPSRRAVGMAFTRATGNFAPVPLLKELWQQCYCHSEKNFYSNSNSIFSQ